MEKTVKVRHHGSFGIVWIIGWLFTVGFLKFGFWKGALALIVWPYFLGTHFSEVPAKTDIRTQIELAAASDHIAFHK